MAVKLSEDGSLEYDSYVEKNSSLGHQSPRKLNLIMIEFLKEKKLRYVKWNNKYKGLNTPDLINAETIQDCFGEFVIFIKSRYPLEKN